MGKSVSVKGYMISAKMKQAGSKQQLSVKSIGVDGGAGSKKTFTVPVTTPLEVYSSGIIPPSSKGGKKSVDVTGGKKNISVKGYITNVQMKKSPGSGGKKVKLQVSSTGLADAGKKIVSIKSPVESVITVQSQLKGGKGTNIRS